VAASLGPITGHPVWIDAPGDQVVRYYTFLEGMQSMNGSGPNRRGKYKSAYMKQAFPSGQVDALWKWLHEAGREAPGQRLRAGSWHTARLIGHKTADGFFIPMARASLTRR
jgi:hypothetical protein